MAPKISHDQYMLETASTGFEVDVKEQQNTKKQTSQLNLLRRHLKEKLFPSSSPSYLSMQASYLQKIREVFHKALIFVPGERKTVHCLK